MEKERKLAAVISRLGPPRLSFPSKDEYVFICPRPDCGSRAKGKPKLAVNVSADVFNCWVCGFAGRSLGPVMAPEASREYTEGRASAKAPVRQAERCASIPSESTPFTLRGDAEEGPYRSYLRRRGVTDRLLSLYRLMYAARGDHGGRIIIPSFDGRGELNLYVARTIWDRRPTYMMPEATKDVVFNEYLVDWSAPVHLVEGAFDAIAVGTQAVPLLGKFLQPTLALRLLQRTPRVDICLDADASDEAWELAEQLLGYDIPCTVVRCPAKDPAEAGSAAMAEVIRDARLIEGPISLVLSRSGA